MMFTLNLTLVLFNMLPLYPLDGGRIFFAILWGASRHRVASLAVASMVTTLGSFGLVILALWSGGSLLIVQMLILAPLLTFFAWHEVTWRSRGDE